MNDMSKKNIKIMLVKSGIGRKSDQKKTLIGLGLNRVGKIRELEDTPSVRGMVNKVSHLVKIIYAIDVMMFGKLFKNKFNLNLKGILL